MKIANLLGSIPDELPEELTEILLSCDELRIERIVSRGHASPPGFWYDQEDHEWVLLLAGKAGLRFEANDEVVELHAGDSLAIPAHERHRVEWTATDQDTIWLAVFHS